MTINNKRDKEMADRWHGAGYYLGLVKNLRAENVWTSFFTPTDDGALLSDGQWLARLRQTGQPSTLLTELDGLWKSEQGHVIVDRLRIVIRVDKHLFYLPKRWWCHFRVFNSVNVSLDCARHSKSNDSSISQIRYKRNWPGNPFRCRRLQPDRVHQYARKVFFGDNGLLLVPNGRQSVSLHKTLPANLNHYFYLCLN